jgi:hypothetical protein
MTYWWNADYTYRDEKGVEHFTDKYLNKSTKDRAYGSYLLWDVDHQCKDYSLIKQWTKKNQLRDEAYWKESPNFRKHRTEENPFFNRTGK